MENYYLYGTHAVAAAIQNKSRKIHKILISRDAKLDPSLKKNLINLSKTKNVELNHIEDYELSRLLNNTGHQGVAIRTQPLGLKLEQIDLDSLSKVAILDQISNVGNFGSIIRSASFFGIELIILPKDNSVSENCSVAKAASGGLEIVKICYVTNIGQAIEKLKKAGFWIAGFDQNGSDIDPKNNLLQEKCAVVLGSEDTGMRRITRENCDLIYKIPGIGLPKAVLSNSELSDISENHIKNHSENHNQSNNNRYLEDQKLSDYHKPNVCITNSNAPRSIGFMPNYAPDSLNVGVTAGIIFYLMQNASK